MEDDFEPADFFVFRTPLLPIEDWHLLSEGMEAPASLKEPVGFEGALERDRARARERLRRLVDQAALREALFVASPSLLEGLKCWQNDPDGVRGQKVERALVRYLARSAVRPTPYGLFAGGSVGTLDKQTRLCLAPRAQYQRYTQLDVTYLTALCDALVQDPALAGRLTYHPSTSMYRVGESVRFSQARQHEQGRRHYLVTVAESPQLLVTLARAARGKRRAQLARALCRNDPALSLVQAEDFIEKLIAHQLLVPDLAPSVTGTEPDRSLLDTLREQACPAAMPVVSSLSEVQVAVQALDREGLGCEPSRYGEIAARLSLLPSKVDPARLFHVSLTKPALGSTLGTQVVTELKRGVALLQILGERDDNPALRRFREDFERRYETREVPLCEALDEDAGIGFAASADRGSGIAPTLADLAFERVDRPRSTSPERDQLLLRKLVDALRAGATAIELLDEDLEWLLARQERPPLPLPDSFAVVAAVYGQEESLRVHLTCVAGPSGANLLGRFCQSDSALHGHVRRYLRAEEALNPEVIFAEVVHLPEGRVGNVLLRPVLREYEIPYLGRSGAAAERHIPVSDLMLSLRNGRLEVRSVRHQRTVIPRLTTAHNHASPENLSLYRFLGALAQQGLARGLAFDWGALASAPYLPRVVSGRLVLAPAQWILNKEQIVALTRGSAAVRYRTLQTLRSSLQLPRFVAIADEDQRLPLDLDNPIMVEAGLHILKRRAQAKLCEVQVAPEDLCATGPEGHFVHELVVPFIRRSTTMLQEGRRGSDNTAGQRLTRRFAPGSEWLYAKLYTGTASADQVLREVIRPLVTTALGSGAATGWHFLRYDDPDWHLRVRFQGISQRLLGEVAAQLQQALQPYMVGGRVFRYQLDTYEREVERYGGELGIRLSERLFFVDSEAALTVIETLADSGDADTRWQLCLCGVDRLLDDLGLTLADKLRVVGGARDSLRREFHEPAQYARMFSDRYRQHRVGLEQLLARCASSEERQDTPQWLRESFSAFRRRSMHVTKITAELRAAMMSGDLRTSLCALASSYMHLHAVRVLSFSARAHERVIYDFLARLYESQARRFFPAERDSC